MNSPFGRACLIVNPRAGGRRANGALRRIVGTLEAQGIAADVEITTGPGDATRIARRRVAKGGRFIVAVGGDGTVHEVVNGLLDDGGAPAAQGVVLGIVAAGSGCDYIRTFGLPSRVTAAAGRLGGDEVRRVDVARIRHVDAGGRPAARHFVNIAEVGLGATTAKRAAELPRLLGQARYLAAFWAVLPSYRPCDARIEVDGALAYEGRAVNVVAANCRYFGAGMHISPQSDPSDGVLELLVFTGRKTDSFTMLPQVYRGRHIPHPHIVELRGRRFRVEAERPLDVEADGEVLGTSALVIEVVPSRLDLKV